MYPGGHEITRRDEPCFIMATARESITWGEYDAQANRLAHYLRAAGLRVGDHYAILMENNSQYFAACGAGVRAGLYYTCINSHLAADEAAYIIDNCDAEILITSRALRDVALAAAQRCPRVKQTLVVGGGDTERDVADYAATLACYPSTPIDDERLGAAMLYSSGTTGRPKGILRPLPDAPPSGQLEVHTFLSGLWQCREGMVYLSPAPLYHSAPNTAMNLVVRAGGMNIVMERFDPEQFLALIEEFHVTHTQLVPTMFSRLLKLPAAVREAYDLSSLEFVVHAAAPCPVPVKQAMIDWLGPIVHEYYGATEGLGFSYCDSHDWLSHPGTVGKVLLGELEVLDDDMNACPAGTPGTLWFKRGAAFEYYKDGARSRESRSPDGSLCTVGDVGYLDEDGYLYLTDRKTFMIISGGVNIYPQECENLLITHPKVADAAVFGVPNEDLGEEVKAVVQPMPGEAPSPKLADELIAFCRAELAHLKCPRSIDFMQELPRLPTGKLYKKALREQYWAARESKLV